VWSSSGGGKGKGKGGTPGGGGGGGGTPYRRASQTAVALAPFPPNLNFTSTRAVEKVKRGAQTKYFLYGAPKTHDHYGLSIICMDKR
jgi:hypothetical protein